MDAIQRLHQVLTSGNRPSPQRFRDAVAEIDEHIMHIISTLPPSHQVTVMALISFRSSTVALEESWRTSDDTANVVLDRLAQAFMQVTEQSEEVHNTERMCDVCLERPWKFATQTRRYCLRCAEAEGIRPRGKIQ